MHKDKKLKLTLEFEKQADHGYLQGFIDGVKAAGLRKYWLYHTLYNQGFVDGCEARRNGVTINGYKFTEMESEEGTI